ncbi:MAG: hypothetical protein U0X20_23415 [Caldilineaceae bacterium]
MRSCGGCAQRQSPVSLDGLWQVFVRKAEAKRRPPPERAETRSSDKKPCGRPRTNEHDVQVVLTKIRKFVEEGAKVRVRIRFRGVRCSILKRPARCLSVSKDVADVTIVESMP